MYALCLRPLAFALLPSPSCLRPLAFSFSIGLHTLTRSRTAMDKAWTHILGELTEDNSSRHLQALFPAEEWIDAQEFSLVHTTVLGLNVLKIDDLLSSIPVSNMDLGDVRGRTALWWTAIRGDYSAMRSLLRYEINASKPTNDGSDALRAASWSGNQECVRLLLPHFRLAGHFYPYQGGWSALHYAAWYGLDADILETMISAGINVNVTTSYEKSTPLMCAAQNQKHHTCEQLLSCNADPNMINVNGEAALHYALQYNSHKVIELLIRRTDYHLKTNTGESLLHCAAQHSDIASLEILCASDIRDIPTQHAIIRSSPTQKPMKLIGLTAREIAEKRTDVTSEWLIVFRRLYQKVDFPIPRSPVTH